MHIYIYDSFLSHKKYQHTLTRIETRITDLGLSGKIIRLGVIKNVHDLINNELKQGAKTIIAVGNNQTLNLIVNALSDFSSITIPNRLIPLGIIPVGKNNNSIALSLGIGINEEACDVLSARRIETLDLGQANEHLFLSQATIVNQGTSLEIDQSYLIEIMKKGEVGVINFPTRPESLPENIKPDPRDGVLELYVRTAAGKKFLNLSNHHPNQSIFSFKKLVVNNKNHPLILDDSIKINTPVEIKLASHKISVIVGKGRVF